MNVTILGAGSWGSALSLVLSYNKNCSIDLYHYNNYYNSHNTFKYLDNISIPDNVNIISSLEDILNPDINLRSSMVLKCINDYEKGIKFPKELISSFLEK